MRELDPRRDSMRKMMIAVAAALSLGTATIATGIMAFGRGGGGGHFGGGDHFGDGGRFGGGFEGGHFGRRFTGGFGGLAWVRRHIALLRLRLQLLRPLALRLRLDLQLKLGGVFTGRHSQSRFASKRWSVRLPIAKRNLEAEHGPHCFHGLVAIVRLGWRFSYAFLPPFPQNMPKVQQRVAKASEYALYALLLFQPLTGLAQ